MDCSEIRILLSGLVDDELQTDEKVQVNDHLQKCSHCRRELEDMRKTAGILDSVPELEIHEHELDEMWKSPYGRFTRFSGVVLVLVGYAVLIFYGLYEFLISDKEGVVPRMALAAIVVGFLVLLGRLVFERLRTYGNDPYKGVKR